MPSHINPTPEHLSTIILNAVKEHHRQLGVGSLALVLKGSKSKLLQNRRLYESKFFGALFYYPTNIIENFVKQLLGKGMIKTVMVTGNPYPLPMLELSPEGSTALESKADINLEVRREAKPVKLNESIRETFRIFSEIKDIPKTAAERNLAESTIWTHLVSLVKLELLLPGDVVSEDKIKLVLEKRNALNTSRLKELKEALPGDISYEEIRCVLAGEEENTQTS
ncbi:helix-turn-helix domain-containing protein [Candidatus Woesearchaeota archaeon]|nr:helix-turn-helix domain-containing protein [Candidatus Woesearchaeota archaeon]